jgi:hypothetical protein
VEAAVPVLLLWRPTRSFGVFAGVAFHSIVAFDRFHPFGDFSTVMFALLSAWLPAEALPRLGWERARVTYAAAGGALGLYALSHHDPGSTFTTIAAWLWASFAVCVLVLLGARLWRRPVPTLSRPMTGGRTVLWAIPALLVANGATPWVGVKNGLAFNMYSNLAISNGRSNSLVLPHTAELGGVLTNPVTILSSSDRGLASDAADHWMLTWDAFRDYASRHPDASVRYQRGGRIVDVRRIGDDPHLRPPPTWQRKVLTLRLIDASDPARCQESFLLDRGDG